MLQNLDYMILSDADISFCMVCKLWYVSIGCIFKNLALKLGIYDFRGVLCMYLSAPPAVTLPPILFPPILPLSCLFRCSSGVRSVCDCVCFPLFPSVPVVGHLLYLFLYSVYCLISLWELYIYCF